MFIYLMMLIFTLIILLMRRDTNISYWNSTMVRNLFVDSFNSIIEVDSIYDFLRDDVGPKIFYNADDDVPTLRELSVIVNPVRFRMVRTVLGDCAKVWTHDKKSCYEGTYSGSTKEKGNI